MRKRTNWFERQRMTWIAEMVRIYGFINRKHLIFKFGVSEVQASLDLRTFIASNPKALYYNTSRKAYVRTDE